jgi:hypothetical protein
MSNGEQPRCSAGPDPNPSVEVSRRKDYQLEALDIMGPLSEVEISVKVEQFSSRRH